MIKVQTLVLRIFGVFGSSALAAVAGGAIFGSWSEDGTLSKEEVAAAFGKKA